MWLDHVSLDWECRDQTWYVPGFLHSIFVTSLLVLHFLEVGLMSELLLATTESKFLHPIICEGYLRCFVEVTQTPSGVWFLRISSQLLSRFKKLGVYLRGWLNYILFYGTSILTVERVVYWPSAPWCFWRGLVKTSSLSLPELCPPAINSEFDDAVLTDCASEHDNCARRNYSELYTVL